MLRGSGRHLRLKLQHLAPLKFPHFWGRSMRQKLFHIESCYSIQGDYSKRQGYESSASTSGQIVELGLFRGNTSSELVDPSSTHALCILLQVAFSRMLKICAQRQLCGRMLGWIHILHRPPPILALHHSRYCSYFELQSGFLSLAELRHIICTLRFVEGSCSV